MTSTSRLHAATRVTGHDDTWTCELDGAWDVGIGVLNGGYLMAVLASGATEASHHPHPVAVSATFLRPAPGGPAALRLEQTSRGRTLANTSATLEVDGVPAVTAQVTTATLHPGAGRPAAPATPPPGECVDLRDSLRRLHPDAPTTGLLDQVDIRLDPATAGWLDGRHGTDPVQRGWVRLADGSDPDPLALVLFSDILFPTGYAVGNPGWAPTVQIQSLVRALPAPGWCLVEARGGHVVDGWVDEDYTIWDSTGQLVAQSRQLARLAR